MAKPKSAADYDPIRRTRAWRENHGTFLLIWAVAIFLSGWGVIAFRQSQFVPPRFPDARAIGDRGANGSAPALTSAGQDPSSVVTLRVTSAASDRGMIQVAIFESSDEFREPEAVHTRALLEIEDRAASWTIPVTVLPRSFALRAYHDENNDGRLNRDRDGRAEERVAFSNQRGETVSPPAFEQAVIPRPMPGEEIELNLE